MVAQPVEVDPRALTVVALDAAKRVRTRRAVVAAAADWRSWLGLVFPAHVGRGFAPYHAAFWGWVWALRPGERARPFVAIWPRGWGKSTSVELACAAVAARGSRRYVLYTSETQEQADDHVQNVAGLLESAVYGLAYPAAATRKVGKYGNARGWRRNRLRTASGFTLDAIGLDTAARGVKLDEARPDLLIFDDLDGKLDSPATTEKKLTTLTHTLLPAGSAVPAVLAVQNLVLPDGIFARLADGRADFLADRIVAGPFPALEHLAHERREGRTVLVAGEPTWPAMGLPECQAKIDEMGLTAFLAECQHEVEAPAGGMFDHLDFGRIRVRWEDVPDLVRAVVWIDPAVTATDQSDAQGIQADGLGGDGLLYRLWSWEGRCTPEDALRRGIRKAVEIKAEAVGVETDQGGDTWRLAYNRVADQLVVEGAIRAEAVPAFREAKAGAGHGPKAHRAGQMLVFYEQDRVRHVLGTHDALERALRRFPRSKPFDLVDAAVWGSFDLLGDVRPEALPPPLADRIAAWRGV